MPIHPVVGSQILFPDGPRTFRHEGAPARFLPGWKPVLAYSGLAPLVIVCFRHEAGGHGMWFLDGALHRCGGRVEELPGPLLAALMDALCPLLDGLLEQLLLSGRPRAATADERSFLELPPFCRDALVALFLGAFRRGVAVRRFDRPGTGHPDTPVLDLGRRRIPLRLQGMHALFDPGLLVREGRRLPRTGRMELPSPVDGQPIRCDRSLVLDADTLVYRLHDPQWEVTAFLVAGGDGFRGQALLVPEAALVLVPGDEDDPGRWSDLPSRLDRHLIEHGEALLGYLGADRTRPLLLWRGVGAGPPGRGPWHDLAGLAALVDGTPSGVRPECLLPAAGMGAEPYGALDAVFPELRGRVRRRPEALPALAGELYRDRNFLYRTSGSRVEAALRERVLQEVPRRVEGRPVLLLGLGGVLPGNAAALGRAIVEKLAETAGAAVLVLDGGTGDAAGTAVDGAAARNVPRAVGEAVREAARNTAVEVVALERGTAMVDRLSWCEAAGMFVAGAGPDLALYRWGANRPGLVLADMAGGEEPAELRVYASPEFSEEPAPMVVVPGTGARDVSGKGGFVVDVAAMLDRFDRLAAEHLRVVEPGEGDADGADADDADADDADGDGADGEGTDGEGAEAAVAAGVDPD